MYQSVPKYVIPSIKGHIGRLGRIPAGMVELSPELDQLSQTSLHHHPLFLALVQKLLLSASERLSHVRDAIVMVTRGDLTKCLFLEGH